MVTFENSFLSSSWSQAKCYYAYPRFLERLTEGFLSFQMLQIDMPPVSTGTSDKIHWRISASCHGIFKYSRSNLLWQAHSEWLSVWSQLCLWCACSLKGSGAVQPRGCPRLG
jgi:hypothetical protein